VERPARGGARGGERDGVPAFKIASMLCVVRVASVHQESNGRRTMVDSRTLDVIVCRQSPAYVDERRRVPRQSSRTKACYITVISVHCI